MTKLFVTQFADQALDRHGQPIAAGQEPDLGTQVIDYTGAEAHGANLDPKCRLIRVHADSIASVKIAAAAIAVAGTDMRFAAGQTEYFGVHSDAVAAGIRVSGVTTT